MQQRIIVISEVTIAFTVFSMIFQNKCYFKSTPLYSHYLMPKEPPTILCTIIIFLPTPHDTTRTKLIFGVSLPRHITNQPTKRLSIRRISSPCHHQMWSLLVEREDARAKARRIFQPTCLQKRYPVRARAILRSSSARFALYFWGGE